MAQPAFRAAGTTSFTANNVANPTTLTPGAPAGKAVGDSLFLVCASISRTATVATPTGWTPLPGFPVRSGTASGGTFYVFARTADGTGNDTPSPVWSGLTNGTSGDSASAVILAFRGSSTVQDAVSSVTDDAADTTTTTIPAVTSHTSGALVLGMALKVGDLSSTSTVATFTEAVDSTTTSGTGHTLEVSYLTTLGPPGSSGTAAITWSVTTSARALAVSVALQGVQTSEPFSRVHMPPGVPKLNPASLYMRLQRALMEVGGPVPVVNRPVNVSLAGTSSLTSTLTKYHLFTATISGTSSLSATLKEFQRFSVTIAGTSSLSASVLALDVMPTSFAGTSSLTATVTRIQAGVITATQDYERPMPRFSGPPKLSNVALRLRLAQRQRQAGGPVPTVYRPVNASIQGTSSLAATFTEYHRVSVTLAGTSSLSTTVAALRRFTASVSGTSSLTANVVFQQKADPSNPKPRFSGPPKLRNVALRLRLAQEQNALPGPVPTVFRPVNVTLAGSGSLAASLAELHRFSATIAGTSSLSGTVTKYHRFTVTLAGTSSLAASAAEFHRFTVTLAGASSLSATLAELHRLTASLQGTSSLTAQVSKQRTLDPERPMPRFAGPPKLKNVPLRLRLAQEQTSLPGPAGAVQRNINVAIAGTSSLAPSIVKYHRFTVTLAGTSSFSATLRELHRLTASIQGTSSLSSTLTRYQRITVTLAGRSTLSGTLAEYHRITVTLAGKGSLAATVAELHRITASLAGTSSLSSSVARYQRLQVSISGHSALSATLRELHRVSATFAGTSSLAYVAHVYHRFALTVAGTSQISASVSNLRRFVSGIAGTSSIDVELKIPTRAGIAGTSSLDVTMHVHHGIRNELTFDRPLQAAGIGVSPRQDGFGRLSGSGQLGAGNVDDGFGRPAGVPA